MGQIGSFGQGRGAPRDVAHRASAATPPRGRFAPPQAGFFCAVASLRPFADAQASPCGARLARAQNNPGQMVPIYQEPL